MELNNFGAIMKFALECENELASMLEKNPGNYGEFLKQTQKNIKLLERTRRECINEAVLQPISGLRSENYIFQTSEPLAEVISKMASFYNDAAEKLPVDEAKRLFRQIAVKRQI
ncbi:MAG: hypothetical protein HYY43_02260 [Deltaproteobacteria bacterium]|nr:hypothetical protein [Deltaproteobacteria bacterium]